MDIMKNILEKKFKRGFLFWKNFILKILKILYKNQLSKLYRSICVLIKLFPGMNGSIPDYDDFMFFNQLMKNNSIFIIIKIGAQFNKFNLRLDSWIWIILRLLEPDIRGYSHNF